MSRIIRLARRSVCPVSAPNS